MSDTMCVKTTETSRCQRCGSEFDWLSDGTKVHAGKRYFESDSLLCLERQLNAANSRIELLMSANAEVARIAEERDAAENRVKRLEAVVNDPHALWINWLRGDVKLPAGIGDVRQYQDRIKQLEEMYEGVIGEQPELLGSNVMGLLKRELNDTQHRIKRLEEALEGTVKWIVHLADSGDAGFWDVEKQSEIIAARAALKKESKP